jgi:hypothetical protein
MPTAATENAANRKSTKKGAFERRRRAMKVGFGGAVGSSMSARRDGAGRSGSAGRGGRPPGYGSVGRLFGSSGTAPAGNDSSSGGGDGGESARCEGLSERGCVGRSFSRAFAGSHGAGVGPGRRIVGASADCFSSSRGLASSPPSEISFAGG